MKAIVFDLDGTLIDSVDDLTAAVNAFLTPLGYPATERPALMRRMGDGAADLLARTIAEAGFAVPPPERIEAMGEAFSDFYDRFPHRATFLFDGMLPALETLHQEGYRLGICTNKRTDLSRALLAELSVLDRFGAIVGGDDPTRLKPHPAPLLDVLAQLDVPPERAVMVGDSVNDITIGRIVGTRTIAARYGFPRKPEELDQADAFVDAPSELPETVLRLTADRRSGP